MDEAALPPELAEKARFELNETKENKLEGIQALRDRISQSRPDITLPEDQGQDTFLVRFLRARKFDPDKAFELLCQYQEFKVKNKSLFEKATASELHFVLEDGIPCVLPESDSNGCRIVVLFAGSWDTDTYGMEEILKALLISIEHLLESEEVQINGIVLLADFTGWGSTHASLVSVSSLRQAIVMFQDGLPIRLKGVHFINEPWYVNVLVTILKPFLKDKIKDRIFQHGNNMSTLHKHLAPEVMPAEFGGDKPEVDLRHWANVLLDSEKSKSTTKPFGENPFKLKSSEHAPQLGNEKEVMPLFIST